MVSQPFCTSVTCPDSQPERVFPKLPRMGTPRRAAVTGSLPVLPGTQ